MINHKAIEALTKGRRQLDQDGIYVGVSRQALDELLGCFNAVTNESTEWRGGECCPAPENAQVEIHLRYGGTNTGAAGKFNWKHGVGSFGYDGDDDIISYRVLTAEHRMLAALKAIVAEPHGCVFCDSGKLRNPAKPHEDDCGFSMASAILKAT